MGTRDSVEIRTCFIVAPIDTELSPIVSSLSRRGIKCQRLDWFDWGVTPISVRTAIRNSDFVCVFSPVVPPANLWFEVGLAIGLEKPIFVVAQQDFLLHSTYLHASFVSATEWKADVVEPHLEAFLKTLPVKRFPEARTKPRPSRRIDFADERKQAELLATKTEAESLENLVEKLFRKARLSVTTSPLEDFGADMAVWSPAIKRKFGEPILVEVKRSLALTDYQWGIERLSDLVKRGRGSAGVYVTLSTVKQDKALRSSIEQKRVPVLMVTIFELIDLLESDRFLDSVRETRNRIHGHGN